MQGKAVVVTGPRKVSFQAVRMPEPGPQDVVIRVLHSWISNGTEGSFIRGERLSGEAPRMDPADTRPFPLVPGYQKTGIVEWVGADAEGFERGDRVFATVSGVEGMYDRSGGHISPAVTPVSQVWKLPDGLSSVAASGLVLTQVGYNCGMRPTLAAGDSAVVIGDGMVGQWAAQTLACLGARVMLLGRHEERLRLFQSGDSRCVNVTEREPLAAIREWAPVGVQVVVDTVGSAAMLEGLVPVLRHNGHLVSAGFCGTAGQIDIQKLRPKEATLHNPSGWTRARMDGTLDFLTVGLLQTEPLITHRFPVERAAAAYHLILNRTEPVLGVVLDWEGS